MAGLGVDFSDLTNKLGFLGYPVVLAHHLAFLWFYTAKRAENQVSKTGISVAEENFTIDSNSKSIKVLDLFFTNFLKYNS